MDTVRYLTIKIHRIFTTLVLSKAFFPYIFHLLCLLNHHLDSSLQALILHIRRFIQSLINLSQSTSKPLLAKSVHLLVDSCDKQCILHCWLSLIYQHFWSCQPLLSISWPFWPIFGFKVSTLCDMTNLLGKTNTKR